MSLLSVNSDRLHGECSEGSCSKNQCFVYEPREWTKEPRKTPPSREFTIAHIGEDFYPKALVILDYWGVSAFGQVVDSDTNDPPFGCSHILSTALMPAHGGGAGKYHNSVATDYWLPKQEDSNRAAKLNAWIYMMTVE